MLATTRLLTQKEQQLRKILWVFNCNVHFRFHNVYFPCWSLLLPSYLTILLLYNFVKTEHNRWWERTIIDTSLLVWKVGSDHLQSKFKFQNNWFSSFMKKVYLGKWIWFDWRFFPVVSEIIWMNKIARLCAALDTFLCNYTINATWKHVTRK